MTGAGAGSGIGSASMRFSLRFSLKASTVEGAFVGLPSSEDSLLLPVSDTNCDVPLNMRSTIGGLSRSLLGEEAMFGYDSGLGGEAGSSIIFS